ncbi:MAG: hypothetical protein FWD71_02970 [Oscillospiraceae bacterium]|nr:hypothetical protein [Oscillospiraceae bacterium]
MNKIKAQKLSDFIASIGANSAVHTRGESLETTIELAKYAGIKWFRSGYEGGVEPEKLIKLHKETGAMISYGLASGGNDINRLIKGAEELADAGALLALDGPNEPNNWSVKYKGEEGGRNYSWRAVAELQSDLYKAVKNNPKLRKYPVFHIGGENGTQTDNCGLQYLKIPENVTDTLMPPGTVYADFANVHNYFCHPSVGGLIDNITWHAADPVLETVPGNGGKFDNLYGNYGKMWGGGHFDGYSAAELINLPRVTTETGVTIGSYNGAVTEDIQGKTIACMYLSQFKNKYSYTALYILRDRVDEEGNQTFGLFTPQDNPRKAAQYLHNMSHVLNGGNNVDNNLLPRELAYNIHNMSDNVHDLLLQKNKNEFYLIIWGEHFTGGKDEIVLEFDEILQSADIYDTVEGTEIVKSLREPKATKLTLADHPIIVKIKI